METRVYLMGLIAAGAIAACGNDRDSAATPASAAQIGGGQEAQVEELTPGGVVTYSGAVDGRYTIDDDTRIGVDIGVAPFPDACQVQAVLASDPPDTGGWLGFGGFVPAPLRVGLYPVGQDLGTVNVMSAPDPRLHAGAVGFMDRTVPDGGSFEVIRITPDTIEGRIRAFMPAAGQGGAYTVDAHFVVGVNWGTSGMPGENHPCFKGLDLPSPIG